MGDVVNLNRYRKQKAREEKAAQAATNRALHGRTKADRQLDAARRTKEDEDLNGKRLDDD